MKQKRNSADLGKGLRVGLSGGIATGKSTVAKIFSDLGWEVLDADKISHALMAPKGTAHASVVALFGTHDRNVIRQKVFENPELRRKLESIMHPLIARESERQMTELTSAGRSVVYEASLLIESGRAKTFDAVVLVRSTLPIRLERLRSRNRFDEHTARAIIQAQWTDEQRSQAVPGALWIDNSKDDLKELQRQVEAVAEKIQAASSVTYSA